MRERGEPLAVARHHHLLQRPGEDALAKPLHGVLLNGEHHRVVEAEQDLDVPRHRVLRFDDGHTVRHVIDAGIGELERARVS